MVNGGCRIQLEFQMPFAQVFGCTAFLSMTICWLILAQFRSQKVNGNNTSFYSGVRNPMRTCHYDAILCVNKFEPSGVNVLLRKDYKSLTSRIHIQSTFDQSILNMKVKQNLNFRAKNLLSFCFRLFFSFPWLLLPLLTTL